MNLNVPYYLNWWPKAYSGGISHSWPTRPVNELDHRLDRLCRLAKTEIKKVEARKLERAQTDRRTEPMHKGVLQGNTGSYRVGNVFVTIGAIFMIFWEKWYSSR